MAPKHRKKHAEARSSHTRVKEQGHTYEDYLAIPEEAGRYELLDGELAAMSPGPSLPHQAVSLDIERFLFECEKDYFIFHAPLDVYLSEYSVLQPDILLIRRDRLDLLSNRGIEGPPDLLVEILSPSTAVKDRGKKMDIYAHYGVPEYWIVDAANAWVEQYLPGKNGYALREVFREDAPVSSPNIPCIHFTMADVIARLPQIAD